ncbi:MAG: hypothetical protein WBH01_04985 [Dehalococcoidia bacterium]
MAWRWAELLFQIASPAEDRDSSKEVDDWQAMYDWATLLSPAKVLFWMYTGDSVTRTRMIFFLSKVVCPMNCNLKAGRDIASS